MIEIGIVTTSKIKKSFKSVKKIRINEENNIVEKIKSKLAP